MKCFFFHHTEILPPRESTVLFWYITAKSYICLHALAAAVTSENAFMFSLKNKDNLPPFKSPILRKETATVANKEYGAIFGNGGISTGIDLFISGHPPTSKCYANLGNSYKLPDGYVEGTDRATSLLAGRPDFTPSEIEVFCQVNN